MYSCINYNYHKFFDGEEIRIRCKKTSAFQEWCQMTPFMVDYTLIYLLWDIFLLQRFLVCVSIVDFWFAVVLKFWCKSLYVYEIVLSYSLNCKFISIVIHLYSPHLMISDFGSIIVHGWFRIFTVYIPLLVSLIICGIFVSGCSFFFSA